MIPVAKPFLDEQEIEGVEKVLLSGMLAQGPVVAKFEKQFAEYCSVNHAVAVNSGTAALHAVLLACGIKPGDEVVVPDFTFFATASCVSMCGAKPVFADVLPTTFNLDPDALLGSLTDRTRAVIGVHLFGQPLDIKAIREICEDHHLLFIEDAAQAHGAEYSGKRVGGLGTAGCFSFYPTKNMMTGEGGMVTTNDPELARKVRVYINHGQTEKYLHSCTGYNYRMTDIGAAIGLAQMEKIEEFNRRRIENAEFFSAHLDAKGIIPPHVLPGVRHVYHQYVVRVTGECAMERAALMKHLQEKGIGTAVHYPIPLH
ncbi:MAG: DegT/DnrJ/EryC1/StrS family aminotransferase, partial [Methanolinea sp.]|nr:DegT/DnrJ/EryC1/StrS family aminotransferase [Methanolinea sp.]